MLESRTMVPKSYSKAEDFQVFNKIIDLIICVAKSDVDNFINLINPRSCPDHMLPLLASFVGYEYDYKESVNTNRLIIEYYPLLIRNRGSEVGIKLATALSVNSAGDFDDLEMLSLFHIDYVEKEGKINIYIYYPNYLSKIRDLIEVVRPAGIRCELIPAEPINAIERITFSDLWDQYRENYPDSDRYKIGDKNRIGFGEIAKTKKG